MVEYDAVIVGAGILGLSTAYHIKKEYPKAGDPISTWPAMHLCL